MAKKESPITKVQPSELAQRPGFLIDAPIIGVEEIAEYVRPPRLKVVQKQADDDLLAIFKTGDLLVRPANIIVAPFNDGAPEPFHFVPFYFFTEFCTWTPIAMRGSVPMIIDRSINKESSLAKKARNTNLREEEGYEFDGKKMKVRHVEHLVFLIAMLDGPLAGEPVIMSFAKGEFSAGTRFASLIKMRKASLHACVFQGMVNPEARKNSKGSWYGIDITNPNPVLGISQWVTDEAEFKKYGELHEEFAKHAQTGILKVDHEDENQETDPDPEGEY